MLLTTTKNYLFQKKSLKMLEEKSLNNTLQNNHGTPKLPMYQLIYELLKTLVTNRSELTIMDHIHTVNQVIEKKISTENRFVQLT